MDDGILTGEGVLLDARPASFASRMLGAFVDLAALAVVILVGVVALSWAGLTLDPGYTAALTILFLVTIMVGIPTTPEARKAEPMAELTNMLASAGRYQNR